MASWRFGTCFLVILEGTTACRKISWDAMMPYAQSLCVAKLTEMGRERGGMGSTGLGMKRTVSG